MARGAPGLLEGLGRTRGRRSIGEVGARDEHEAPAAAAWIASLHADARAAARSTSIFERDAARAAPRREQLDRPPTRARSSPGNTATGTADRWVWRIAASRWLPGSRVAFRRRRDRHAGERPLDEALGVSEASATDASFPAEGARSGEARSRAVAGGRVALESGRVQARRGRRVSSPRASRQASGTETDVLGLVLRARLSTSASASRPASFASALWIRDLRCRAGTSSASAISS